MEDFTKHYVTHPTPTPPQTLGYIGPRERFGKTSDLVVFDRSTFLAPGSIKIDKHESFCKNVQILDKTLQRFCGVLSRLRMTRDCLPAPFFGYVCERQIYRIAKMMQCL